MTNNQIIKLFQADANEAHSLIEKLSETEAKEMLELVVSATRKDWKISKSFK